MISIILKGKDLLQYIQTPPRFLSDGWLERIKLYSRIFKGKIFESRYVSDKKNYIKLMNWVMRFKNDQLCKVKCNYAIKVPVTNRIFFAVFSLGPRLSSTSPHGKSKLHLKHR